MYLGLIIVRKKHSLSNVNSVKNKIFLYYWMVVRPSPLIAAVATRLIKESLEA